MITIQITGFLSDFTSGEQTIAIADSPQTVANALVQLWARHVGLRDRVVTERGQVRPHVGIYVNTDNIRHRMGLDTTLADGDEITILPAISGGRERHKSFTVTKSFTVKK